MKAGSSSCSHPPPPGAEFFQGIVIMRNVINTKLALAKTATDLLPTRQTRLRPTSTFGTRGTLVDSLVPQCDVEAVGLVFVTLRATSMLSLGRSAVLQPLPVAPRAHRE